MGKLKKEVRDLDGLRFMMNMLKEVRQRESGITMEINPIMNMYQVSELAESRHKNDTSYFILAESPSIRMCWSSPRHSGRIKHNVLKHHHCYRSSTLLRCLSTT